MQKQSLKRKKTGLLFLLALFIVVSVILYVQTYSFRVPKGPISSIYGPAFFPRALLIVIIVLNVILGIKTLTDKTSGSSEDSEEYDKKSFFNVLSITLLSIVFFLGWQTIGFIGSSIVYVLVVGLILRERRLLNFAVLISFVLVLFYLFETVLNVNLQ